MSDLPPCTLARCRVMQQIFAPQRAYVVQFEKNGLVQYSRPVYGQNDQIVRLKAGFVCDRVNYPGLKHLGLRLRKKSGHDGHID